jgi:transcription-repair coupling factor (superfamily II helicase)
VLEEAVKGKVFLFAESLDLLIGEYQDFLDDKKALYEEDQEKNRICLPVEDHFLSMDKLKGALNNLDNRVEFGALEAEEIVSFAQNDIDATLRLLTADETTSFVKWSEFVGLQSQNGVRIMIGLRSEDHFSKIKNLFSHRGIEVSFSQSNPFTELDWGGDLIRAAILDFSEVMYDQSLNLLVIPETTLIGQGRSQKSRQSPKLQNYINSFRDLKTGDLVVHILHGIARYTGMKTLDVSGFKAEFLILEYKGGDKIYLPVDKLNLLQKYSSGETGSAGSIDSLKSKNWQTRKSKAKKAVRDMAEELLKQHAKRTINSGVSYSSPSDEYFKFEGSFPYEETDDQRRVISEVNFDLTSQNPMDRLVCGDVGFGKTEVALRAAFRVAYDHHQVIVLVPTTVLCYQHFRSFKQRLEPFGLKVEQMNRFVSRADQNEIKERFAEGAVDVLVGTHRILSKDIKANRLGLVIVDEEQRFGVAHKEKLKQFKAACDILTLSATPIPRTLHLSMLGLRDISIITTPPVDRLYVKTYVAKFDESLIKEAIERELARGGQVFYVHNRVQDIGQVAALIKALVPSARIKFAHGQMTERKLEDVIVDFLEQRFDVLVCTTIIESGIDMPNVNTLIVDRSDRFGLAQLYQLRGRVGRSTRQAYAYFMTPSEESLAEDSRKRLEILASHQELGSGFQIASHDMELRGVGNLLGGEQSGKISDIGLDLYTEMLEATIREMQGDKEYRERRDVEIKLPVQVMIPQTYIKEESVRLQLYKSIFSCEKESDLDRLRGETRDRFGAFDRLMERLFNLAYLKVILLNCNVEKLVAKPRGGFEISFLKLHEVQISALIDVVMQKPKTYRLTPNYQLFISALTQADKLGFDDENDALLSVLIERLQPLQQAFTELELDKDE